MLRNQLSFARSEISVSLAVLAGASLTLLAPAALAQGAVEVDEVAAERAIERALVQTGSVLLAPGAFEIVPFLSFQRDELDRADRVLLQDGEAVVSNVAIERNQFDAGLVFRAGLPWAAQIDLIVPYSYSDRSITESVRGAALETSDNTIDGIGDVSLTYTQSLRPADAGFPNILASLTYDSDTGVDDDNLTLGSGFEELRAALTITQRQDPLVLSGRISYETTFEKDGVEPSDVLGLDFGAFLAVNPDTSLQLGLSLDLADDIRVDGQRIDGTDQFSASLNLGLASILRRGTLLDTTVSVGLTDDAPDVALSVSLPIRLGG